MAALVATPQQDTPLGGENYVIVTIEEVELSLNAVVALPSDDEDDNEGAADAALEARVAATQQVADVQELWMLDRSAKARRDAGKRPSRPGPRASSPWPGAPSL